MILSPIDNSRLCTGTKTDYFVSAENSVDINVHLKSAQIPLSDLVTFYHVGLILRHETALPLYKYTTLLHSVMLRNYSTHNVGYIL